MRELELGWEAMEMGFVPIRGLTVFSAAVQLTEDIHVCASDDGVIAVYMTIDESRQWSSFN